MNLEIEITAKCSGHGRCYVLEPGLFEPDDDGFALVERSTVDAGTDSTDGAAARRAALACPEGAVMLTEVG